MNDDDQHGAAASFDVTIEADTSLDDTDLPGSNPGEPYLEVEIDGEDVTETEQLSSSTEFTTTITLSEADLAHLEEGDHDLTVELWDENGAEFDDTDLGNDDGLDSRTTTTPDPTISRVGRPRLVGVTTLSRTSQRTAHRPESRPPWWECCFREP